MPAATAVARLKRKYEGMGATAPCPSADLLPFPAGVRFFSFPSSSPEREEGEREETGREGEEKEKSGMECEAGRRGTG